MKTKTNTRSLQPTWTAAQAKKDQAEQPRTGLAEKKVQTKEFGDFESVMEFGSQSAKHGLVLVDILNNQLHIKYGSRTAQAAVCEALGIDKPEYARHEDAKQAWVQLDEALDYIAALEDEIENGGGRSAKDICLQYKEIVAKLERGELLKEGTLEKLGIRGATAEAQLKAFKSRYKAQPKGATIDLEDL